MSNQGITFDSALLFEPERVVWPANWAGHVPFAAWLIKHHRPNVFVELGTYNGFSYSAFCQAIQEAGVSSNCYAIDTWQGDDHSGFYENHIYDDFRQWHDQRYVGISRLLRKTFDEAVTEFDDDSVDLLHIDGLHTYEAVRHDFNTWRQKLTSRGIVLFHDTQVRERDFGVWRLWDELSAEYPHIRFDHSNGLGVLLLGKQQSSSVMALQQQYQCDPNGVREIFKQLGERIELKAQCRELQRQRIAFEEAKMREFESLRQQCDDAYQVVEDKSRRLDSVLNSRSWRVTSPLRWLAGQVRR